MALWKTVAERSRDNPLAELGYIDALIVTGGMEKAFQRATAFARKHPRDERGHWALARIAEARGDEAEVEVHLRLVLQLKPDQHAMARLGTLLLRAGRFKEAESCAADLQTKHPAHPAASILRAQLAERQHGFPEARRVWQDAMARCGKHPPFLAAYGTALLSNGDYEQAMVIAERLRNADLHKSLNLEGAVRAKRAPFEDHTGYWHKACAMLPDSADLLRKLLHAALSSRNMQAADQAFTRLLALDRLTVADADSVVGLALACLVLGNRSAAQAKVRLYLKRMHGLSGYRAAALRLDRLVLAAFPKAPRSGPTLARRRRRFSRIVEAAQLGPGATQELERIARLEQSLSSTGANFLLDSDVDPALANAFVCQVRQHLREHRPFSLIRLGDGEANALSYEPRFAPHFDADAAERENVWWGRNLDGETRSALQAQVREAIENADALGIPTKARLLRDIRLDTGRALTTFRSGRGVLAIMAEMETRQRTGKLAGKSIVSAHIHHDLQRWSVYPELFRGVGEVVLVSCHPALPEIVQSRFGVPVVKHVVTPPGDSMLEIQHRALSDNEIPPASLSRALTELSDWSEGRLVLVGAGYIGKIIVAEAKRRGGVALDLGSIFDHWSGVHTRSYQDLT